MTKPFQTTVRVVRDPKTGRQVEVRGAGALKGHLAIDKRVDLTKPIAAQSLKADRKPEHKR